MTAAKLVHSLICKPNTAVALRFTPQVAWRSSVCPLTEPEKCLGTVSHHCFSLSLSLSPLLQLFTQNAPVCCCSFSFPDGDRGWHDREVAGIYSTQEPSTLTYQRPNACTEGWAGPVGAPQRWRVSTRHLNTTPDYGLLCRCIRHPACVSESVCVKRKPEVFICGFAEADGSEPSVGFQN